MYVRWWCKSSCKNNLIHILQRFVRGIHNKAWISYTMWLNLLNLYSNISILFQILVTLYKKIRKSHEILGNKDSANPWILSESIKIWNLVHDNGFLHVADPSSIPQCKRKEAVRLCETNWTPSTVMCPGFEEWWLYKWVLSFQNSWSLIFMLR